METLKTQFLLEAMSPLVFKSLLPALIPAVMGLLALLFAPLKWGRPYVFALTLLGLGGALFFSLLNLSLPTATLLNDTIIVNLAARTIQTLILFCAVLAFWMTYGRDAVDHLRAEIYSLMSFAVSAILFIPIAQHLVFLFIAIEIMSLSVYVLVSMKRPERASAEAGLKYFILGGTASAMLLYGMALFYGAEGHFSLTATLSHPEHLATLGKVGIALMLVALLFKVGAFPLHYWVADIYQGAAISVTAFMSTLVKIGTFSALLKIFHLSCQFEDLAQFTTPLFITSAVVTLFIGHLSAIRQHSLKRMLAYSSLAHTGYMMLGVASEMKNFQDGQSIYLYLFFYTLSNLGAFSLLSLLMGREEDMSVEHLAGLSKIGPMLALCMSVFMLGMAGIPLTAGFVGKYWLLSNAISQGMMVPVVLALLGSLISVYYYLRPIVLMYMAPKSESYTLSIQEISGAWSISLMMGILVIFFGIFPKLPLQFLIAPLGH